MIEIFSKPADEIGTRDIKELIALRVSESEQIEFKEGLSTNASGANPWMSGNGKIGDRARDKILEEVTAFANAFGGVLVLGIRESRSRPPVAEEIVPVERCAELSERLKLMFRDCVDPPLSMLEIVGVPFENNSGVVVIRVGRSRFAPHRVRTTRVCPVRRHDRREEMTMREVQDMTLNVSRGLERLDKRLSQRSARFPEEFDKLGDPQNAFGIRMTALPVGDEFRFDRVFSQGNIIEALREPWHRVTETKADREPVDLEDLPHEFKPTMWRPMLRAARAETVSSFEPDMRALSGYREIHCDGLIEWGLLSCERCPKPGEEKTCPFPPYWPILQLANLIAWAHRVRIEAGAPTAEYALDIQVRVRGHATKVMNPVCDYRMPWLALLAEGSTDFPRYSLRDTDEAVRLIRLFKRDFWNSFGKDIGANEGEFEIENWPEHEPNQGS